MSLTLGKDASEKGRRVGSKCVVLRAVGDMHCPDCNELPQAQLVLCVGIPEPNCDYTGIICKHYLKVTLRRFVAFAWCSNIVKIDYAAHKCQIARSGLKGAQVSFFIL